ncbi:MAG: GC-type dockerin domain-anchored protein, partial [Phycisphaerales bacterium]
DENWAKMYSGTSFNLPAAPSGHRYQTRWGVDGAYLLSTPLNWCEADLNFDGELDFFDISLFIAAYNNESVWANLQEDNRIDFFDVSTFLQAFQTTCP